MISGFEDNEGKWLTEMEEVNNRNDRICFLLYWYLLHMWDVTGLLFGAEIGLEWLMKWEAEN